jgi:Cys-tRNA(Pro)/Cys-tRNA(Cys) deacylase
MSKVTRATQALDKAGVAYAVFTYDYDPGADRIGVQAAESLGIDPGTVLKTLMAEVDGRPVCVLMRSDREVNMKKLAAAFRGKSARMMAPAAAERATGYHVGGISPFGQKRAHPAAVDEAALAADAVFVNGGQRGLQLRLAPHDLVKALSAFGASLS